jgi:hypothetical protein
VRPSRRDETVRAPATHVDRRADLDACGAAAGGVSVDPNAMARRCGGVWPKVRCDLT